MRSSSGSNRLEKSRAQRILWLLEELRVPYALKIYKRGADMLAGPELKAVHPLGKSPVITIAPAASPGAESSAPPRAIAETACIVEYLTEHFGPQMVPERWSGGGKEGAVGSETDEWMTYRHFMHYAEGSLMPYLVLMLVAHSTILPLARLRPPHTTRVEASSCKL